MTPLAESTASGLHARALVWDNHACPPQDNPEAFFGALDAWQAAGVNVVALNIGDSDVALEPMVRLSGKIRAFIAANADRFCLISTPGDLRAAKSEGRLGIFFDVEGGFVLDGEIGMIETLYALGVRWMAMVYNRRNTVGSGVHDDVDDGLTPFGRSVVAEMDRVGLVKCLSHTGYRTARDVLGLSQRPSIFSHSNPRALCDHPRNIPDDLIDACAAAGGVIGINGVGIFLGDNDASPDNLIRHIDYVVQRVGADHVGLGLDNVFDLEGMNALLATSGHIWPPRFGYRPGIAFMGPEQLPAVTEGLVRRGYAEADILAILGGNLERIAQHVWRTP